MNLFMTWLYQEELADFIVMPSSVFTNFLDYLWSSAWGAPHWSHPE
jgi:hypothetical protein